MPVEDSRTSVCTAVGYQWWYRNPEQVPIQESETYGSKKIRNQVAAGREAEGWGRRNPKLTAAKRSGTKLRQDGRQRGGGAGAKTYSSKEIRN